MDLFLIIISYGNLWKFRLIETVIWNQSPVLASYFQLKNVTDSINSNQTNMEIFQTFRKHFKWMCISANYVPFGLDELKRIFGHILSITSLSLYLFSEAKTIGQYVNSIQINHLTILLLVSYLSFRFKSHEICRIIDKFEQISNRSEWKINYFPFSFNISMNWIQFQDLNVQILSDCMRKPIKL